MPRYFASTIPGAETIASRAVRNTGTSMPQFSREMLAAFSRVLKPGGRLVLLTGAQATQDALAENLAFTEEERFPILVSGKSGDYQAAQKGIDEKRGIPQDASFCMDDESSNLHSNPDFAL